MPGISARRPGVQLAAQNLSWLAASSSQATATSFASAARSSSSAPGQFCQTFFRPVVHPLAVVVLSGRGACEALGRHQHGS